MARRAAALNYLPAGGLFGQPAEQVSVALTMVARWMKHEISEPEH